MKPAPKRRGRRPADAGDTRESILEAAREVFLTKGYDRASYRAVALKAGVDAALVHHYFDEKADLFAESIRAPIRPARIVKLALEGPREQLGANLVVGVLTALENQAARDTILSLIRTALGHDFAATMLRQFLVREVFHRIADELAADRGDGDGELRATLAASQVVGLVLVRFGIRADPLVEASIAEVAARVGPVIQWHLVDYPQTAVAARADPA